VLPSSSYAQLRINSNFTSSAPGSSRNFAGGAELNRVAHRARTGRAQDARNAPSATRSTFRAPAARPRRSWRASRVRLGLTEPPPPPLSAHDPPEERSEDCPFRGARGPPEERPASPLLLEAGSSGAGLIGSDPPDQTGVNAHQPTTFIARKVFRRSRCFRQTNKVNGTTAATTAAARAAARAGWQRRDMYNHDGQNVFVIDGHMHFWNANPENWKNKYGESWIKCFHAFHSSLSPAEEVWPFEKFCRYDEETLANDLFRSGYVDMAILNSTYLYEFYKNGFNSHTQNNVIEVKYPDRSLLSGSFDPRDEEAGFDVFRRVMAEHPIQGLKLYTAEWRDGSRSWRLNDSWAYKYLTLSQELGIKNIHVHKGPTVYPLSSDSFDVRDVDYAATDFPDLNFIVEHVGLPRLDDFCWIATQEADVFAGLSMAMAFVHLRPRYFGEIMANLLFWLGPDRLALAVTRHFGHQNG
jgi:uncharacterized protein